jgi:hypothetical protein
MKPNLMLVYKTKTYVTVCSEQSNYIEGQVQHEWTVACANMSKSNITFMKKLKICVMVL